MSPERPAPAASAGVAGRTAAGFEAVGDAFRGALEGRAPCGAALSVWVDGEAVVDLWGGTRDAAGGVPWERDTASVIFSCTKALVAVLAAQLVSEGSLDYDALVADYWPEFARAGKEHARVSDILAHRVGLSAPREDVSVERVADWGAMTALLARQEPLWPPGSGHEYHALTFGWLAGELIRRVTGVSVGEALRARIAEPLHGDIWIGLPADAAGRVADLVVARPDSAEESAAQRTPDAPDWGVRSLTLGGAFPVELVGAGTGFNDPRIRAAEVPGAGGIATARALAKTMSATVVDTDGVRLLDEAAVRLATVPVSAGRPVFGRPPPWSRRGMGFQLDSGARRYLSAGSFGHDGAGGQVALADPGTRTGLAFITNRLETGEDDRATRIIDAVRAVLTEQRADGVAAPARGRDWCP
ncbi:serine hydrolase domain-containing protein [Galbitalea sp. SE-J8]|uniref:serine hydrolase domain-containing protein n=1 Tax=Galbitalea sp. SE-J8 TaxID=3054952 RepID=UPI00259C9FBD|nr:serine hydrolase domain-containing protein [Galbitalea sp. SE-J8]MDM4762040.1 serine hydrolase domain-containing protein [Galbitalea sp. SE-J8]